MRSSTCRLACAGLLVLALLLAMLPLGASAITNTTTSLSASATTVEISQSVTYTATVSPTPDGGTMNFKDGASSISGCGSVPVSTVTGKASCSLTYSSTGVHTVTAVYSGTANFSGSTSGSATVTVNKRTASLSLTSSANPAVVGQSLTYTVSISPIPTSGTMTLTDNGSDVACSSETFDLSGVITCIITYDTSGTHTITASYSGNSIFDSKTTSITETINPASTTTSLSTSASSVFVGTSVTFTATVSVVSPGSGSPVGGVSFFVDNVQVGGAGVNASGQATFTTNALSIGSHSIKATFNAGDSFASSTSSTVPVIVSGFSTSTSLSASPNPAVVGQAVTYTATVSPLPTGGTVEFKDGATTISGCGSRPMDFSGKATCTVVYTSPGTHSVTATYSGDSTHVPSTSSALTETVNKSSSSTTLSASPTSATFGQSITFTAKVTAVAPGTGTPTGSVTFSIDGGPGTTVTLDGSGQASLTTSSLSVGSHSATASYNGDANFNTSASSSVSVSVGAIDTTTAISSSVNPVLVGQSVTYTATVSPVPSGGTVAFKEGAGTIPGCGSQAINGSGQATCTVAGYGSVGSHSISASFSGDASHNASDSTALTETVGQATTSTGLGADTTTVSIGQTITFTATVTVNAPGAGTPTGTVTFKEGATTLQTSAVNGSGQATFATSSLSLGNHTITAVYNGDTNFHGSTSLPVTVSVGTINTTTGLSVSANSVLVGQSVTYTATVSPASPGTIAFFDGATPIGGCGSLAVDGTGKATCTVKFGLVGTHSVTASYSGDSLHNPSTSGNVNVTVSQASTSFTLVASTSDAFLSQPVTYTATVSVNAPASGTPTGTVTFTEGATTLAIVPLNAQGIAIFRTDVMPLGGHVITASYSGDGNFAASGPQSASVTVHYRVDVGYVFSWSGKTYVSLRVTDFSGKNLSAPTLGVTALCIVANTGPAPASCGATPALSLNTPLTFVQSFDKSRWQYRATIDTSTLTAKSPYYLLVQVDGDSVVAISFTAR